MSEGDTWVVKTMQDGKLVDEVQRRPSHFYPTVVGDLGYVDQTVVLFGYYDFLNDLDVVEQEMVKRRARSDEINRDSKAIERQLWGNEKVHRRYMDATPITLADLSEEGRRWLAPKKDEKLAAINYLRLRIRQGKLRVHPRCVTTIAHARYGRWNKNRTDFERPEDRSHHYDGLAALIYFVRMLDRRTNPYPPSDLVALQQDHHIPHTRRRRRGVGRLFPERRWKR